MRKLRTFFKQYYLFIALCPVFGNGQVILRLVEAEYSATANVAAYITAKFAEDEMKKPLVRLKNISVQENAYFSVTTEFYGVFLVHATITVVEALLVMVEGLNTTTPIFFNRRLLKYQNRIAHYRDFLKEMSAKVNASNVPTNRGNSAKLTLSILSELHRVSYELGKMFDYLYVRNAVSLLPI